MCSMVVLIVTQQLAWWLSVIWSHIALERIVTERFFAETEWTPVEVRRVDLTKVVTKRKEWRECRPVLDKSRDRNESDHSVGVSQFVWNIVVPYCIATLQYLDDIWASPRRDSQSVRLCSAHLWLAMSDLYFVQALNPFYRSTCSEPSFCLLGFCGWCERDLEKNDEDNLTTRGLR